MGVFQRCFTDYFVLCQEFVLHLEQLLELRGLDRGLDGGEDRGAEGQVKQEKHACVGRKRAMMMCGGKIFNSVFCMAFNCNGSDDEDNFLA